MPVPTLRNMVRAGFILDGTTLNQWCKENGVHRSYAERALDGDVDGPKANELAWRLYVAAGLTERYAGLVDLLKPSVRP